MTKTWYETSRHGDFADIFPVEVVSHEGNHCWAMREGHARFESIVGTIMQKFESEAQAREHLIKCMEKRITAARETIGRLEGLIERLKNASA